MTDKFTPEAQRYLDGAADAPADARERADAQRLRRAVTAFAEAITAPDPDLDERVMAAVKSHPDRRGVWSWLTRPQGLQVRPVAVLAVAALFAALLSVQQAADVTAPAAPPPAVAEGQASMATSVDLAGPAAPESVLVRFELEAPLANDVALTGSFTGWTAAGIPLATSRRSGVWTTTVALPPGEHRYGFLVNGTTWMPDPAAHAQIDDGFGRSNSVLVVGPRGVARP